MTNERKTVLIVEDEAPLRNALKTKLEKYGYNVLDAANGDDGLKLALDRKPDLILLDIIMPEKTGIDVLRELRQDAWGKNARVIMLTNVSKSKEVMQAVKYNADFCIKSDWRLEEIVKEVSSKMEREEM